MALYGLLKFGQFQAIFQYNKKQFTICEKQALSMPRTTLSKGSCNSPCTYRKQIPKVTYEYINVS